MEEREPIDLNKNEKQKLLFRYVDGIVKGTCSKRVIFYGGAIRGGKTIGTLACMLYLAIQYPGCKVIIIRNSLPSLRATTLDSFKLVFPDSIITHKNNTTMEYTLINGSRIQFFAESYQNDKDLDRFKGLECNFILLEQLEELQEATFNKSLERVGSYKLPDGTQPPGIILATFNPTHNWVKNRIYRPYVMDELPKSWVYIKAGHEDNPFVTDDQREAWSNMDTLSKKRYVEGDWEAISVENQFAWAFKPERHIKDVPTIIRKNDDPYYVSFDFNIDPMCAIILSHANEHKFHVVAELRLPNTDVIGMCRTIRAKYGNNIVQVTGDASGRARNQASTTLGSHYTIIQRELGLQKSQIRVSNFNVQHRKSQVIVNTVLEKHPDFAIHHSCDYLISDLVTIKMTPSGNIDKSDSKMGHLLDSFRYAISTWSSKIIHHYDLNEFGTPILGINDYSVYETSDATEIDENFFSKL